MSESEIRAILRNVCERLARQMVVPVGKIAVPVALGAALATGSGCFPDLPPRSAYMAPDVYILDEGWLDNVPEADNTDPGNTDSLADAVDNGPIPPYMGPDVFIMDAVYMGPDPGPVPEYMAADAWLSDPGAQPLYVSPDPGPVPEYMAADAWPLDSGMQPLYVSPDPGPVPDYMAADAVDPDPGIQPPYMAPDAGPMPAYKAPS
jgi:hypothetical protein